MGNMKALHVSTTNSRTFVESTSRGKQREKEKSFQIQLAPLGFSVEKLIKKWIRKVLAFFYDFCSAKNFFREGRDRPLWARFVVEQNFSASRWGFSSHGRLSTKWINDFAVDRPDEGIAGAVNEQLVCGLSGES
jgi:hypothetical protein